MPIRVVEGAETMEEFNLDSKVNEIMRSRVEAEHTVLTLWESLDEILRLKNQITELKERNEQLEQWKFKDPAKLWEEERQAAKLDKSMKKVMGEYKEVFNKLKERDK